MHAIIGRGIGGIFKSLGSRTLFNAKGKAEAPPKDDVPARIQVSCWTEVRKGEFTVKEIKPRVIIEANPF